MDVTLEINDNEFLRQFELEVEEHMARIEYALQDRKIFLTKYVMPSDMEDLGFREIFIKAVFRVCILILAKITQFLA